MERKKVEKTSLIQINWLDKLFLETYKNQLQINCQINQFFLKKRTFKWYSNQSDLKTFKSFQLRYEKKLYNFVKNRFLWCIFG